MQAEIHWPFETLQDTYQSWGISVFSFNLYSLAEGSAFGMSNSTAQSFKEHTARNFTELPKTFLYMFSSVRTNLRVVRRMCA